MKLHNRRIEDRMSHDRKNLALSIFAYGTLGLMAFIICLLSYWWFFPYKTAEVSSVKTYSAMVAQGGKVSILIQGEMFSDVKRTNVRHFVDGLQFSTPIEPATVPVGPFSHFIEVIVPETLPPGKYKIVTDTTFHLNPIRQEIYSWETEQFEVIAKDGTTLSHLEEEVLENQRLIESNRQLIEANKKLIEEEANK